MVCFNTSFSSNIKFCTGIAKIITTYISSNLNSIFENGSGGESCDFVFNEPAGGTFSCSAFLTTINPSVSVGDIQAVSVNFQISGAIEGRY